MLQNGSTVDASRYFDNAATTSVDPEVFDAMRPYFCEQFGNPHSIHGFGVRAHVAVEKARATLAGCLGASDPSQIVFTSGATESCNLALRMAKSEIWITPCEHSAVREPGLAAGAKLIPAHDGQLGDFPAGSSVYIIKVCNETGGVTDPLRGDAAYRFSDYTQAVGKIPLDMSGLDSAACSAHKFHGPKGVGLLYVANPDEIDPSRALIRGGTHEHGARAGTLNVPGIVGMAKAMELAVARREETWAHAAAVRAVVLEGLEGLDEYWTNDTENQIPHILSCSFHGLAAQALVIELDMAGYATSAGPACSAANPKPSEALISMGLNPADALSTLRISFGPENTLESAAGLSKSLRRAVEAIRKSQPATSGAT